MPIIDTIYEMRVNVQNGLRMPKLTLYVPKKRLKVVESGKRSTMADMANNNLNGIEVAPMI